MGSVGDLSIKETFYKYSVFGKDSHDFNSTNIGLDSRNFSKLMRDAGLLDYLEAQDIDLVFIKCKDVEQQRSVW